MTEEIEPHILQRYEILQRLGKGAYGVVWKAIDKRTKDVVAVKKVFDAFHNATDAQRTYREVMFLQQLNNHPNVIRLTNIIKAENNKDLYLVFDFMETDLHIVIRGKILEEVHYRSLKYVHSGELIHRDLKPSNVLLDAECNVKVADFGLARSVLESEVDQAILTEYVATRWYRAPEILLGSTKYTKAVDMWSVGCILGEMINGKAIFPGTSTLNQIERVLEVIGRPSQQEVQSIQATLASQIIQNIPQKKRIGFTQFFPKANAQSLDLMRRLLAFDPDQRITVDEALRHPYVQAFHNAESEVVVSVPITVQINDNKKLSIKDYRDALYACISNQGQKYQLVDNQSKESTQQIRKQNFLVVDEEKSKVLMPVTSNYVSKQQSSSKSNILVGSKKPNNFTQPNLQEQPLIKKQVQPQFQQTAYISTQHQRQDSNASFQQTKPIIDDTQSQAKMIVQRPPVNNQRQSSISVYSSNNNQSSQQRLKSTPKQQQPELVKKLSNQRVNNSFYIPPTKSIIPNNEKQTCNQSANYGYKYGKEIQKNISREISKDISKEYSYSKENSFMINNDTSFMKEPTIDTCNTSMNHQKVINSNFSSYQTYLNPSKVLCSSNNANNTSINAQQSRQNIPTYLNYASHQRASSSSTNPSVLAARCKEFLQNMHQIKK